MTNTILPAANLRSADDWRAFVHQLVPVAVSVIVALNLAEESTVLMWVPFALALADNLLSAGNTVDKLRRTVYAVVAVLQTGGLVTALVTDFAPAYVPVAGAVLSVLSAFMARFYTPTTTAPQVAVSGGYRNPWRT